MNARLSELFSNIYYLPSRSSMDSVENSMVCEWLNEAIGEMGSTGYNVEED